jgi:hypothetical protein
MKRRPEAVNALVADVDDRSTWSQTYPLLWVWATIMLRVRDELPHLVLALAAEVAPDADNLSSFGHRFQYRRYAGLLTPNDADSVSKVGNATYSDALAFCERLDGEPRHLNDVTE